MFLLFLQIYGIAILKFLLAKSLNLARERIKKRLSQGNIAGFFFGNFFFFFSKLNFF